MPLTPYEEFASEPLAFPIGGKTYTVKPIGWADGIRLTAILTGDEKMPDAQEQNRLLMGDTLDEMVADGVPAMAISRALLTCLTDFRMGRETAERVWAAGLTPEALAPNGATETAKDSTPSSSSGEALKTRKRASMTGTTSPTTPTRAQGKAKKLPSST